MHIQIIYRFLLLSSLLLLTLATDSSVSGGLAADDTQCNADPGYYCHLDEQKPCPRGTYCLGGQSQPVLCHTGTFSVGKATACTPCPAGWASEYAGATFCRRCPNGTFPFYEAGATTGATRCQDCEVGHYCDHGLGMELCRESTYATKASYDCKICTAGYELSQQSGVYASCEPCTAGQYSPDPLVTCASCPKGHVALPAATTCTACTEGYYPVGSDGKETENGAVECAVCEPGHRCAYGGAGVSGGSWMEACNVTKYEYQPMRGRTSCLKCGDSISRKYLFRNTTTECIFCGVGDRNDPKSISYYVKPNDITHNKACLPCNFSQSDTSYCSLQIDTLGNRYYIRETCPASHWRPDAYSCEECAADYECDGTATHKWVYKSIFDLSTTSGTINTILLVAGLIGVSVLLYFGIRWLRIRHKQKNFRRSDYYGI